MSKASHTHYIRVRKRSQYLIMKPQKPFTFPYKELLKSLYDNPNV